VVCFNWSTRASARRCPRRELINQSEKAPDGNKDVWKCRSSRHGKDFLTCIKCTRDCLSNLHNPDQVSMGGPFLPKKWVLGDHFCTENFGPGDRNFQDQNSSDRTKPSMGQTHSWDLNPLHHCMCVVVLVNHTASYKIFSWVEESLAYIKRDRSLCG